MRETTIAILLGAGGSLLANAIVFAIKRVRQWGASRFRVLLATNVTALVGGGVAFGYIAWDSISHNTAVPIGGSVAVACAFAAMAVLGYFFSVELVKTTRVRTTLARIDAILKEGRTRFRDAPELADGLHCALTAIREVVGGYGAIFEGGRPVVSKDLVSLRVMGGKQTIRLAWEAVKVLVDHLTALERFRHASVISDEGVGLEVPGSEYEWVIDPIDGSRHVARDLPVFTVSIALVRRNQPLLGVVYVPVTDELYFGIKDRGAYLNTWANELHVSKREPDEAIVHVEFPNKSLLAAAADDFLARCESLEQVLSKVHRVRGLGVGSLGLAYVAKGAFDGYITFTGTTLRNDVCAGLLLVEEAGGKVREFAVPQVVEGNIRVLAANEKVFNAIEPLVTK